MAEAIKITREDIQPPHIDAGGTAIIFQRHGAYERDFDADEVGSVTSESANEMYDRDTSFFQKIFQEESEGASEAAVLFVASDTQYGGGGYRSMETSQIAQNACIDVIESLGLNPEGRIINLNQSFNTKGHKDTAPGIRPAPHVREPKIFENPEYIAYLQGKYGSDFVIEEDGELRKRGLSKEAWVAHETDTEKVIREKLGAEGIEDIADRTDKMMEILAAYSSRFHQRHPGKRLIVWVASHYDTISPFVKRSASMELGEYVPVENSGGVVISISPEKNEAFFMVGDKKIKTKLGETAINH